jgi:hypothetical protein
LCATNTLSDNPIPDVPVDDSSIINTLIDLFSSSTNEIENLKNSLS